MTSQECGSELFNPFCLVGGPTDPYSWVYFTNPDNTNTWTQALQWQSQTTGPFAINDMVVYNGRIFVCTSGPNSTGCTIVASAQNPNGVPTDGQNNMRYLSAIQPGDHLECTNGAPMPDPQTGQCMKSPLGGPEAACVNPCIRLPNGQIAVNKNSNQCRVFPSATDGGIAGLVSGNNGSQCATVCPQACVELWETCPPGTAPVSTLVQTKSPVDVLSLTGPYLATGDPNPLWPANYSNQYNGSNTIIGGKPYTECYSYNTEFCELPMAWMETTAPVVGSLGVPAVPSITQCFANCPPGTFQDPTNSTVCLFAPTDGSRFDPTDPTSYGPTTPVQKVFCNPQYYNPAYWNDVQTLEPLVYKYPGYVGTQKGCISLPLPTKQGSTCPVGTAPIINENFNLEWCIPDCPSGYFSDLTQSTCVATCQGSTGQTGATNTSSTNYSTTAYNTFLDYVDFYATTARCEGDSQCVQNYTHGRCPAIQQPLISLTTNLNLTEPKDISVAYESLDIQCASKNNTLNKGLLSQIKKYQMLNPMKPGKSSIHYGSSAYATCPDGMAQGDPACLENEGLCYDTCAAGYEPATLCRTGAKSCGPLDLVYICRAACPEPSEGLGPWAQVSSDPLFTCAYEYPQGQPPADPNSWVQCPDDGRYYVLQSSPTDISVTASTAARREPLCVRKTYLRQSTCFIGTNPSTDPVTGLVSCVPACDVNDVVVTVNGTVVCQNVPNPTSRHEIDFVAVVDSQNAKGPFKNRVMTRKNITRGYGTDPSAGIPDPTTNKPEPSWLTFLKWGLVGIAVILLIKFLLPKKKLSNTKRSK